MSPGWLAPSTHISGRGRGTRFCNQWQLRILKQSGTPPPLKDYLQNLGLERMELTASKSWLQPHLRSPVWGWCGYQGSGLWNKLIGKVCHQIRQNRLFGIGRGNLQPTYLALLLIPELQKPYKCMTRDMTGLPMVSSQETLVKQRSSVPNTRNMAHTMDRISTTFSSQWEASTQYLFKRAPQTLRILPVAHLSFIERCLKWSLNFGIPIKIQDQSVIVLVFFLPD